MALTIPDEAVALFPPQSAPDSTDVDIIAAGDAGMGVLSGAVVSASSVVQAGLFADVSAGQLAVAGQAVSLATLRLALAAAGTTDRRDLIVAADARNMLSVVDAGFEAGVGSWVSVGSNTTAARSTAKALDGTASLSLTSIAAGDMGARTGLNLYPVTPGKVYSVVASFLAGTVGRAVHVECYWMQSDGATIISTPAGAVVGDNPFRWTQAILTAQAPAGAAYIVAQAYVQATGGAAEVHYVDRVAIFASPAANLALNPDFENGTGSWTVFNATVTQDTTQAYTGRSSAKIVATGANAGISQSIKALPGTVLTFSAYGIQPTGATSWSLRVFNDTGGAQVGSTAVFAATAAWATASTTITVPASGSVSVQITTGGSTGTIYVDAVRVEVGQVATPFVPPTYSNLVTNPSFEVDLTGWTTGGGSLTLTRDTSRSYLGSASGKFALVSAGAVGVVTTVPVQAGVAHTFSYYCYVPSSYTGSVASFYMDLTGPDAFDSANFGPDFTKRDQWQRVTGTVTPTASGMASLRFVSANNDGVGTIWVDAVQCELGRVANPYIDGAQGSGYSWDASGNFLSAANASFEDGTTGAWGAIGTGVTGANSAVRAFDGTKSMLGTIPTGMANGGGALRSPAITGLTIGQTYTATIWLYIIGLGGATGLQFRWVNAAQNNVLMTASTITTVGAWARAALTFTATETTAYLDVCNVGATTSAMTFDVDAVQFEQRAYATAYAQNGTANAATATWVPAAGGAAVYVVSGPVSSTVNGVTPVGQRDPVKAALPAGAVALAEVYVAAATTALAAGNVIDKRMIIGPQVVPSWQIPTSSGAQARGLSPLPGAYYQTLNLQFTANGWVLDDDTKTGYIWIFANASAGGIAGPVTVYKGVNNGAGGVTLTLMFRIADDGTVTLANGKITGLANGVAATDAVALGQADGRYMRQQQLVVTPEQYGAVGDGVTDDTAAFQAMVDAVGTAGFGICLLGTGYGNTTGLKTYLLNSNPRTDRGGNAIVALPSSGGGTIAFVGSGRMVNGEASTVIQTTLTGKSYSASFGPPSIIGGPTTENHGTGMVTWAASFEGLRVVVPANPTLAGIDLERWVNATIRNCVVRSTNAAGGGQPTSLYAFGVRLPTLLNYGNIVVDGLDAFGFYAGLVATSHAHIQNYISKWCVLGLGVVWSDGGNASDPHALLVDYWQSEWCTYHVAGWTATGGAVSPAAGGRVPLRISMWDIEDAAASNWYTTTQHVLDANSTIRGQVTFVRIAAGTGVASTALLKSGGTLVSATSLY